MTTKKLPKEAEQNGATSDGGKEACAAKHIPDGTRERNDDRAGFLFQELSREPGLFRALDQDLLSRGLL